MTAARPRPHSVSAAVPAGTLLCVATACASGPPASAEAGKAETTWEEPASYDYTLTSATQVLAGTFRVQVRDGTVAQVTGIDADSRRQSRELPGQVPTMGELLKRLDQARRDHADTAEAEYAADGHPLRITLDEDKNAVDDEALYVISSYDPTVG
ncbi:DUF6174 domain-containing protein [Streptomyces sp. NPDC050528]|uniref:DUF6174 domain-containing protein n=1 Tax=Streptomyces sp. NPDC050528 TaxID=3365623 RepID=UPI0037992C28